MDLRRLRYFVAVAESGNISKAAQKIFLTQPALSRQIKALEEAIGLPLIERQAHSIRLTPAGETLLVEARELLRHAEAVLERVRACGAGIRLRIGYAPSLASGMLSAAVESFVQKHPAARVELLDLSSQEMLEGLESGTLDVALTVEPAHETRGLRWTPLVKGSWRLAVHHRHPLAERTTVSPEEVAREPLLIFCQRDYPEYWNVVNGWFRKKGLHPTVAGEYNGLSSLLAGVESRLGVALVSTTSAEFIPQRVSLKKLSLSPQSLLIAAGYREGSDSEKPFAVFIEELRHAARSSKEVRAARPR